MAFWILLLGLSFGPPDSPSPFVLQDGDRIAFLGDALVESMPRRGDFELRLATRFPDIQLTFRNLAHSGDTVFGEARAGFDTIEDGYRRRLEQLGKVAPTVLFITYGANESWQGEAGLDAFQKGYNRLLDDLKPMNLREIVLVGPPDQENLGPPFPDPSPHNEDLARYRASIRAIANDRGFRYISLADDTEPGEAAAIPAYPETDDGLHPTAFGHWVLSQEIERALGLPSADTEALALPVKDEPEGAVFAETTWTAPTLPAPAPPDDAPPGSAWPSGVRVVRAAGLPPGRYALEIDGQPAAQGSHEDWAAGIAVAGPEQEQLEALRAAIVTKNRLFFDQSRPQNDVYLFGFRKHEQGQNAAEIPLFDPLIEQKEAEIDRLRQPQAHSYRLIRLDEVSN